MEANLNRCVYKIDINFFKEWNSKMAYILGFTFADGSVVGRTLAWDLHDDKELLIKINNTMKSNYPIKKRKASFRLRISNPVILRDIRNLIVTENKSKRGKLPALPNEFIKDFIRGFLDGDGWIISNHKKQEICVGFSSGNLNFLRDLTKILGKNVLLTAINLRKKVKKNGKSTTYQVEFYSSSAYNIIKFLYDNLGDTDLFLYRKYKKQLEARKIYENKSRGGKKWREIEDKFGKNMRELLTMLIFKEKLTGEQIAEKLSVHPSSIYRWLEKTEVRVPVKRGSEEWKKRIR